MGNPSLKATKRASVAFRASPCVPPRQFKYPDQLKGGLCKRIKRINTSLPRSNVLSTHLIHLRDIQVFHSSIHNVYAPHP